MTQADERSAEMPKGDLFLDCVCSCSEHLLRVSMIDWDNDGKDVDLCFTMYLTPYPAPFSFIKRLWYGAKYILGHRTNFAITGAFDSVLLGDAQQQALYKLLKERRDALQ